MVKFISGKNILGRYLRNTKLIKKNINWHVIYLKTVKIPFKLCKNINKYKLKIKQYKYV